MELSLGVFKGHTNSRAFLTVGMVDLSSGRRQGGTLMVNNYVWELCKTILIALPFYLLIRKPWMTWSKREAALAAFVLFMIGLLVLTVGPPYQSPAAMLSWTISRIQRREGINLVPFRSISSYFRHFSGDFFRVNFIGNILMFMPWGFGLVLLWRRKQRIRSILLCALGLTLFIETVQLFIGRSVDVDDIILNFLGSCLGAILYFILRKKFPKIGKLAL